MPTDEHNRTADFKPSAEAVPDPDAETLAPPPESGPGTFSQVLRVPDSAPGAAATGSVEQTPAVAEAMRRGRESHDTSPTANTLPDIPGYVVEGEIARGGMGVVYRARHLRLNRPAAVKMILGGKYHDPTARIRFLIEAEAVAALDHPHVVHVHEFGTHHDLPFFALEFVGGGTLAGKIKSGKPSPREAAGLLVKLADGIAAAHAKGIVHRDLKPANVLLTEGGEPKITDFGLAKVGQSDMTATGAVMGTPSYMSPEQAAGRTKETGTSTDVYALGAILYEMLTTWPPFLGDSSMDTIQQVITKNVVPPRTIEPSIPRDLETICLKCLEKDAKKRYATATDLAADLRAFLDGRPIVARPVGAAERAWKWVKRNPGRAAAVAAGVVVLVGGLIAATEVRNQREADRLAAETQRADDRIAAEEKRASDLRETRAGSLVQAVATADTTGLGRLIEDMKEYRDLTGPKLRELVAQPVANKPGLHARLALLADESGRAAELAAYLPSCKPEELLTIRDALKSHAVAVAPPLWAVLTDAKAESGKRVRAASALAGLTPDDPRWGSVAAAVVEGVVKENPLRAVVWSQALEPVRGALVPALVTRYPESRAKIEGGKLAVSDLAAEAMAFDLAANLLARYAERPADLAELAVIADPRHYADFAAALRAKQAEVVPVLKSEVAKAVGPRWAADGVGVPLAGLIGQAALGAWIDPDPVLEANGKRKGHAAAALVALGEGEAVWPVFAFPKDGDPTARSYLLQRLAAIGADPLTLIRRFGTEADVSAQRALLIALGDFPTDVVPAAEREPFVSRLLALYRNHPDAGLHGANDWLLRQKWGKTDAVAAIDAELAVSARVKVLVRGLADAGGPLPLGPLLPAPETAKGKDWFVNGEGQTYAVVRGPVEFTLGSPPTEPGRSAGNESPHRKRIPRTFAVATKEVTNAEFLRFQPRHRWTERYSPGRDTPAVSVTWYHCAAYCNWLSEREGIPADQWCYEPNKAGEYADGMRMKSGHLERTGYRLPTEAEWEYACRGGAATARHHGRGEELLPRYGWYQKNAEDRAWGVGRLRPNDYGLFDTLGNAFEWTEDPALLYATGQVEDKENSKFMLIDERTLRLLRGGSFINTPVLVRCANRSSDRPSVDNVTVGFRPVRTSPD